MDRCQRSVTVALLPSRGMPKRAEGSFQSRLLEAATHAGLPYDPTPIAKRCKVNRQTIHRLIKGGLPKPDLLYKIADSLKVDARWLATGKGELIPSTNHVAPEERNLLEQVYRRLEPEHREEWIRQGYKLVEFLTPAGPHNPFSPRRK